MVRIVRKISNLLRSIKLRWKNHSSQVERGLNMHLTSQLRVGKNAKVIIGERFNADRNVVVRVEDKGNLAIGKYCYMNCNVTITTLGKTIIGDYVQFGPNVMVFDHDHDFRCEGGLKTQKLDVGEISIGNNVWIGAGAIILRGAHIGDNSVVAAGSIVRGDVPENMVLIQKRTNELKAIN